MPSELAEQAINVARNVGPVFPCREDKKPATQHGFKDASRDPGVIERMFSRPGAALIGVPTGEVSGFDVLDVDTGEGDEFPDEKKRLKRLSARTWLHASKEHIPSTRIYRTQSGGYHVYFDHGPGIANTESHLALGVDTRGNGGYAIFWYAHGFECTDHSPRAAWPSWLLEGLFYKPEPDVIPQRAAAYRIKDPKSSAQRIFASVIRKVEAAPDGQRHHVLRAQSLTAGGVIGMLGISEAMAARHLLDAILVAGGAHVDQANALATIRSGLQKGAAAPLVAA
jgi:hypothetical protein